jgi:hypothetical protein
MKESETMKKIKIRARKRVKNKELKKKWLEEIMYSIF